MPCGLMFAAIDGAISATEMPIASQMLSSRASFVPSPAMAELLERRAPRTEPAAPHADGAPGRSGPHGPGAAGLGFVRGNENVVTPVPTRAIRELLVTPDPSGPQPLVVES